MEQRDEYHTAESGMHAELKTIGFFFNVLAHKPIFHILDRYFKLLT